MTSAAVLVARNNKRHLYIEEEEEENYGGSFKRSRCGASGFADGLLQASEVRESLATKFPELDRSTIQKILESSGYDVGTAIARLKEIRISYQNSNSVKDVGNTNARQSDFEKNVSVCDGFANPEILKEPGKHNGCEFVSDKAPIAASEWVHHFVQQMMSASDIEDGKFRAASALEAFEKAVVSRNASVVDDLHQENGILKKNVMKLEFDNQILKRAVLLQNEKLLEQESSSNENQQLKKVISEHLERIRSLEVKNYELNLHLQQTMQRSSTIPGHFNRDVF